MSGPVSDFEYQQQPGRCDTCRWWVEAEDEDRGWGICRRKAPGPLTCSRFAVTWPSTRAEEWCGECDVVASATQVERDVRRNAKEAIKEPAEKLIWHLYRASFKDGDLVVAEDESGNFYWGRLKTAENGISLIRVWGGTINLAWENILFMAHDGFPVKKIRGMSESRAEWLARQTPTDAIRQLLEVDETPGGHGGSSGFPAGYFLGGGCPFLFGPFAVESFVNRGNVGPEHWGEDSEELVVLRSADGARCHLSDLSHHFFAEAI